MPDEKEKFDEQIAALNDRINQSMGTSPSYIPYSIHTLSACVVLAARILANALAARAGDKEGTP